MDMRMWRGKWFPTTAEEATVSCQYLPRRNAFVVAILALLISLILIVTFSCLYTNVAGIIDLIKETFPDRSIWTIVVLALTAHTVHAGCSVLLIYGTLSLRRAYVSPWIVSCFTKMALLLAGTIAWFLAYLRLGRILYCICVLAVASHLLLYEFFMLMAVFTFYHQLKINDHIGRTLSREHNSHDPHCT